MNKLHSGADRANKILRTAPIFRLSTNQVAQSRRDVIDRLLERSLELKETWNKIAETLTDEQLESLLSAIVDSAAYWSPKKIDDLRGAIRVLSSDGKKVAGLAAKLAKLLNEMSERRARLGLARNAGDDPMKCLAAWANPAPAAPGKYSISKMQHRFSAILAPELVAMCERFHGEPWPTTADLLLGLSTLAKVPHESLHPADVAATASRQASAQDFERALMAKIHNGVNPPPKDFKMRGVDMANIFNVALAIKDRCERNAETAERGQQRRANMTTPTEKT